MPRVVLHVGAFKTGTTFLQSALTSNRDRLASEGVLFPGGHRAHVDAVGALLRRYRGGSTERPDAWDELATSVRAWDGEVAVVSSEFLSTARKEAVEAAVSSFPDAQVEVVLGARDLVRSVPAQWQESLQGGGGRTWTLEEYSRSAMMDSPRRASAAQHFWRRHNWYQILRRWGAAVPSDRLHLMTVPPAGAPSGLLLERFASIIGFDSAQLAVPAPRNASLGAASLEVLRRLNALIDTRGLPPDVDPALLKRVLAGRVMAAHRQYERGVGFSETWEPYALRHSTRLLSKLAALEPRVTGRLDDLAPHATRSASDVTSHPEQEDASDLVEAARFAADRLRPDRVGVGAGLIDADAPPDIDSWVEVLYVLVATTLRRA